MSLLKFSIKIWNNISIRGGAGPLCTLTNKCCCGT